MLSVLINVLERMRTVRLTRNLQKSSSSSSLISTHVCRTCCLSRYEIIIVQGRIKEKMCVMRVGKKEEAATVAIERVEKSVQKLRLSE